MSESDDGGRNGVSRTKREQPVLNSTKDGRTAETERAYLDRADLLMKRYVRESGDIQSIAGYVDWLQEKTQHLRPATSALYRAASAYTFEARGMPDVAQQIREIRWGTRDDIPSATSSEKAHGIRVSTQRKVLNVLSQNDTEASRFVALWSTVSLYLGLRPCEYETAIFSTAEDGTGTVTVHNAKATNGRGNGRSRTLVMPAEHRAVTEACQDFFSQLQARMRNGESFKHIYLAASTTLRRAVKHAKLKGKSPTLYTFRHQFAANLRRSHRDLDEIAALMGHLSDQTNLKYYGSRGIGQATSYVKARPEERAPVHKTAKPSANFAPGEQGKPTPESPP
ncbi:MAG: site-specific integrase [Nevskiaceae bacterium]|nr:MAG: site-specific integrase [Burkholderiaceae bacterium]TBR72347.1 MAG: site-specific integrase [Nevskiaceae bacterium]